MRNIVKISVLMTCLTVMAGCNDFVDIESPTVVRKDQYFKTQADFSAAVSGLYSGLRQYYGGFYEVAEIPSDNSQINGYTLATGPMDQLNWLPSTAAIQSRWSLSYTSIARANAILDRINEVAMPDDIKKQFTGEAKFIRSLMYFNLVQFYGAVPLVLNEISSEKEAYSYGRTPVGEVYNQIVSDLTEASSLLPESYNSTNLGRVTRYAALGLLGKVFVTNNKFDNAIAPLEEVVNSGKYQLLDNYADVFSVTNKHNQEIIFDIQYLGGAGYGEGSNFSISFAPFGSGTEITSGGMPASVNSGTLDLFDAFQENDKRRDVSIKLYPSADSLYYTSKFLDKPIAANEGRNNWPVLRYSDVLLLLAEAYNEIGSGEAKAESYLNVVKQRAGLNEVNGLSQQVLREEIWRERRLELCFEGNRWFDLLRTGTMLTVMRNYKEKYAKYGAYLVDNYVVTDNKVLFPVPFREISLNPELEQNDGY